MVKYWDRSCEELNCEKGYGFVIILGSKLTNLPTYGIKQFCPSPCNNLLSLPSTVWLVQPENTRVACLQVFPAKYQLTDNCASKLKLKHDDYAIPTVRCAIPLFSKSAFYSDLQTICWSPINSSVTELVLILWSWVLIRRRVAFGFCICFASWIFYNLHLSIA